MFLVSIMDGQQVKLMQRFLSNFVTGDIELIQYCLFLTIKQILKPIAL